MATIRRLAAAGAYSFSQHAFDERMVERGFDIDDVLKIMEHGDIDGPIVAGRRDGNGSAWWSASCRGHRGKRAWSRWSCVKAG
jgi:hypothetical protein